METVEPEEKGMEEEGGDVKSESVQEAPENLQGDQGDGPEDSVQPDEAPDAAKGPVWKRKTLALAVVFSVLFVVLLIILLPSGNEKKTVSERQKIERFERVELTMPPFFIPLEGGKAFLRLRISLPGLPAGLDRIIAANPHEFRERVIRILEGRKVRDILHSKGKERVKKDIETGFHDLVRRGAMGIVRIDEFTVV